jgi:phage portal protein BeeE
LCLGTRNPKTDIRTLGYGHSELEDLINTITNLLNADMYNGNYFRVGSNPNGVFVYKGDVTPSVIQGLRNQWSSQVAGVSNFHKTPFINAQELQWISTHASNRDMEYGRYQEFLIKTCCALYKIDPSEIGFNLGGSEGAKPMFEGNNTARLEHSKDKGLIPLLTTFQDWINRYIIKRLNPDFEFVFVGLTEEEELTDLESDIKLLTNFMTINEIRAKRGLKPIKGGDIIMNPTFTSSQQQDALNDQLKAQQGMTDPNQSPFDKYEQKTQENGEPQQAQEAEPAQAAQVEQEPDPITKALILELPKLFN